METNSTNTKLQEVIMAKTMESLSSKPEATKKVKESKPKAQKTPTAKATKKAKKESLNNLMEEVISNREVKYLYPADCLDTLSRKKWRQGVRNELRKLELALSRIEDKASKEYKAKEKEYKAKVKEYMKPSAKIA